MKRTRVVAAVMLLVILAVLVGGCVSRESLPRVVYSYQIQGAVWPVAPEAMISPDRKWVLTTRSLPSGLSLVCLPITAESKQPVVVAQADAAWLKERLFGYYPLGWTTPDTVVFMTMGWQNDGPHKGQYGVGVWQASATSAKAEEVGFLPLSQGLVQAAYYVKGKAKIYFHVTQSIWEFDLEQKKMRQVKGNLPSYDGLFYPKPSPNGDYFVYDIYEDDRAGVCLLDVATGEEKVLLSVGDQLSFYPTWSPDGKYIACYTVPRKPGSNTGTWEDYEVLPSEDGPQPVAQTITIVDTQGKVVQSINVQGKLLSNFKWAEDSKGLGFAVGVRKEGQVPTILVESLYMATLNDERLDLVELCKVEQMGQVDLSYVVVHNCRSVTGDMLCEAWSEKGPEVYYLQRGKQPVKMTGSLCTPGIAPSSGNSILGVMQQDKNVGLWLFGPEGARKIADLAGGDANVVGLDRGLMVIASGDVAPLDKEAVRNVHVVRLAP